MLARRRTLKHPSGGIADTPLLVPSFTSKGFPFFVDTPSDALPYAGRTKSKTKKTKSNKTEVRCKYSETTTALESTSGGLAESLLISAYDLYHRHYRRPMDFLANTALVFLDSGGYELAPDFDSTEPRAVKHAAEPFTAANYDEVLCTLKDSPGDIPFVISNFDWDSKNQPIEAQVVAAQGLFNRFPNWLSNFILKPHTPTGKALDVPEIIRHAKKLRGFGVIGVTEKELGKNLIERLKHIASLRRSLDENNVDAPIHVWGGLDPLMTPLYFFAGAELFDGVSWLRYSYYNGMAVNRECHGLLSQHGIETSHDHMALLRINENLTALQRLSTNLREFADCNASRFDMFGSNATLFERAYRTMTTKVPQMKEGA